MDNLVTKFKNLTYKQRAGLVHIIAITIVTIFAASQMQTGSASGLVFVLAPFYFAAPVTIPLSVIFAPNGQRFHTLGQGVVIYLLAPIVIVIGSMILYNVIMGPLAILGF